MAHTVTISKITFITLIVLTLISLIELLYSFNTYTCYPRFNSFSLTTSENVVSFNGIEFSSEDKCISSTKSLFLNLIKHWRTISQIL